MSVKLTRWYPHYIKPVRAGWYQCRGTFCDGHEVMRYWNGMSWMWNPDGTFRDAIVWDGDDWRGLAQPPKGKA